jgi:hypothetical protein
MTPHFHLRSPTARPEVNVVSATFARGRCLGRSAQQVSREGWSKKVLLVILHYLLKNNITFMWGMEQGKTPPEGVNGNRVTGIGLLTRGRWGDC